MPVNASPTLHSAPCTLHPKPCTLHFALCTKCLALLLLLFTGCSQPQPPNIVLIYIDDLGWRDMGFMGSTYYETPHIDGLAASGMTFTDAYANAPNCAPSRAALLSGQYAPRHGVYTVASAERGESRFRKLIPTVNTTSLDTSTVLISEALQQAGYTTAHFGKWHLGNNEYAPGNQGFNVADEASWRTKRSHFMPDTGEYMADYLTDRAIDFLGEQGREPFFLYLSHYGVHTPIESKPEKIEKFSQKEGDAHHFDPTYAGMIESIDESVGRVLAALEEEGFAENTVVLFFADNGGYGPITKMHPLRGAKGMLYEGGIREPLVVRWPGKVQAGSSSDTPVIGVDLYPTFLDVAGISSSASYTLDGESLLPILAGEGSLEREAIYWHFPAYLEAYRDSEVPWRTTPVAAVRSGDYKLIEFFGEDQLELYNLKEDIGERNNLAEEMPEKVDELYAMMQTWREQVNAPVPTELNPEFDADAYEVANALHNPYR